MTNKIRKSGGSAILSIPKVFLDQLGWEVGEGVSFEVVGGSLRVLSENNDCENDVYFVSSTDRSWVES